MDVLEGLMAGKSLDCDSEPESDRVFRERGNDLEKVFRNGLDDEDLFVLKCCVR